VTFVADQNPTTIEWARTPPPPLLEALETLYGLMADYRQTAARGGVENWVRHTAVSYQTAYNVMLRAFIEEYAP
jgi:hypothetical protein